MNKTKHFKHLFWCTPRCDAVWLTHEDLLSNKIDQERQLASVDAQDTTLYVTGNNSAMYTFHSHILQISSQISGNKEKKKKWCKQNWAKELSKDEQMVQAKLSKRTE